MLKKVNCMTARKWVFCLTLVIGASFLFTGCSALKKIGDWLHITKKKPTTQAEAPAVVTPPVTPTQEVRREPAFPSDVLQAVHFDFDKSNIRPDAAEVLDKNAQWLRDNPNVEVQIEGHCDERGTIEYNYNLGQRRAESVKQYLIKADIDEKRLHTISYGEERPADTGHNEAAWAKNRRAQFLVYKD